MNLFFGPVYLEFWQVEFWQSLVLSWASSSCDFIQNIFNDFDMELSCNVHNPSVRYFHEPQKTCLVHEFFNIRLPLTFAQQMIHFTVLSPSPDSLCSMLSICLWSFYLACWATFQFGFSSIILVIEFCYHILYSLPYFTYMLFLSCLSWLNIFIIILLNALMYWDTNRM